MSNIHIAEPRLNERPNCDRENNGNQKGSQRQMFMTESDEINKSNEYGWSPLYRTIIAGNNEATVELLKMGADPNKPNSMEETPLYQAVEMENVTQVKTLLEYGANPNYPKSDGNTPLHYAVKKSNCFLVKELLSHGCDPNIQNKLFHQTPLHLIVKSEASASRSEIAKLLLDYGASPLVKDKYDSSALDYVLEDESLMHLMKSYIEVKESFDNQNNISIISKGELYMENAILYSKRSSEIHPTQSSNQITPRQLPNQSKEQPHSNQNEESASGRAEISDVNPIDFINQMITNPNASNIFSELQEVNDSASRKHQSFSSDTTPQIITPEKYNIESLENMSYSKSKSIIISELPLQCTSKKKDRSELSITTFTIKKLKGEDKECSSIYSVEDSNCNKKKRKKYNNKDSSLNIINLAEKFDDKHLSKEDSLDKITNMSNMNTQDLSQNANALNVVYSVNTANSQLNKNTASHVYSVNSTRPQTQMNKPQPDPLSNRHILHNENVDSNEEEEDERNDKNLIMRYDNSERTVQLLPKANHSKQLHQWLCSIDLLCYYNRIHKSTIFDLNKFSNGSLKGHSNIDYSSIEAIGIKKPGHIFRLLLKLQSDSMHFNQNVFHFLLPNRMIGDARLSQSHSDLLLNKDSCCGCIVKESKLMKLLDLDAWLKFKGLGHLREHFIHNGFESIEYVLIQMFSEYQLTDESLLNYFHMYNPLDRKVLLRELLLQKKKICAILSLKFNDMEYDDTESNCKSCMVF